MEPVSRIEQINQLVRAFAVVSLLVTLEVAFLWGSYLKDPVVSIEAYIGVLTFAMTWWFKSRDDKQNGSKSTTSTTIPPVG